MLTGIQVKTNNYTLSVFWPTEGEKRDYTYQHKVGTWIAQNQKVLDKKIGSAAIGLICEEFPGLSLVEARDFANRLARWSA